MEARPIPSTTATPHLRLVADAVEPALAASSVSLRPWILLFGALSFSGGHGVFLFTALTRLANLPGRAELGGALHLAVVGWFVAAAPLALLCVPLRGRFLLLSRAAAWTLSSSVLALTLAAFGLYLRAVALA